MWISEGSQYLVFPVSLIINIPLSVQISDTKRCPPRGPLEGKKNK